MFLSFCINNIKNHTSYKRLWAIFIRNGKDMDENNVPEIRPTFEEVRKVDDNGKEYWSSHEFFNAMVLLILKASNIYKNEI